MKNANCLCASSSQHGVRGVFLSHASPSQPGVRFGVFVCVSLCAPPSQPGVRSFCFCAHLRLNLGCVVFVFVRTPVSTWGAFCFFFFCVSLCAPPSQPGVRSFCFLCASPSQPGVRGGTQEQHHRHNHALWPPY